MSETPLNHRALALVEQIVASAEELRIAAHTLPRGGRVLDFGVEAAGGLEAREVWLAIVLGHLTRATLSFVRFRQGRWRHIQVELEPG